MRYKITTLTMDNFVLKYTISKYTRVGDSIEFVDERTKMFKSFPASRTQTCATGALVLLGRKSWELALEDEPG